MYSLRFLIIGRTEHFIDIVQKFLSDLGFSSDHVIDTQEGYKKAISGDFNILIIDATANGFDYNEYLHTIIESNEFDHIFAFLDQNNRIEAVEVMEGDMFTCLNYPFDRKLLQSAIINLSKAIKLKQDVQEKEKRLLQLEVINEIARKTLSCKDEEALLWDLAELIHTKLGLYNVNIFLVDKNSENIVMKAFAGGFGDDLVVGYSLPLGKGITGWVAQNRESMMSGDVRNEPQWVQGFEFEDQVNSELAVPIIHEDRLYGVLHVESKEKNGFTNNDVMSLETVAGQMSLTFENLRLSSALLESKKLSDTVNDAIPASIIVLDREYNIDYANYSFCESLNVSRDEIRGKPLQMFLSHDLLDKTDLMNELKSVSESGISISHSNIRHTSPDHPEKILNISLMNVDTGKHPRIMVLMQDVTEFTQKTYQLLLLREISLAMQGVYDRDKLLHLILTSVTAGFAIGFNRAFLFLVDDNRKELQGIMGVGPSSYDEAYRIWGDLSQQGHTLENYLEMAENGNLAESSLQAIIRSISLDLKRTKNVLTETVTTKNHIHVLNAWKDPLVDDEIKKFLASEEFVTIPLIVRNEVIGVLMADNAFSGRTIGRDSVELLKMLGVSAATAIENAKMLNVLEEKIEELQKAYCDLKKAEDMIIRNEKLAAIGEVSARLAHEIRNPLATIGGFAKSIPKKYDNKERTIRNANIIVEEVERLEHILITVLDFSKPSVPEKSLTDINELITSTLQMFEGVTNSLGVIFALNFNKGKLEAEFDKMQIKQVFINIIQNSLNAMPQGGAIEINTSTDGDNINIEITDTGHGIPSEYFANIFQPFFTTHGKGTGLGLSICLKIIQNHNGSLTINSGEGKGTTVNILLPKK